MLLVCENCMEIIRPIDEFSVCGLCGEFDPIDECTVIDLIDYLLTEVRKLRDSSIQLIK